MRAYPLLSLLLLAACTGTATVPTKVAIADPRSAMDSPQLMYPKIENPVSMAIPETVSRFLLALPPDDPVGSLRLRKSYLMNDVRVQKLSGQKQDPDYLIVDTEESHNGFWLRSFHGTDPRVTAYLVQIRGRCADLPRDESVAADGITAPGCGRGNRTYFDSGMRAYRVVHGHLPEDVTTSIAPDPAVVRLYLDQYAAMGANPIAVADDNLDRLPIFRWVVEFDPEQTSSSTKPPIFDGGHHAHAGFIVWNGERFERRKKVPRALWPCRIARPSECPARPPYDDQFVTD